MSLEDLVEQLLSEQLDTLLERLEPGKAFSDIAERSDEISQPHLPNGAVDFCDMFPTEFDRKEISDVLRDSENPFRLVLDEIWRKWIEFLLQVQGFLAKDALDHEDKKRLFLVIPRMHDALTKSFIPSTAPRIREAKESYLQTRELKRKKGLRFRGAVDVNLRKEKERECIMEELLNFRILVSSDARQAGLTLFLANVKKEMSQKTVNSTSYLESREFRFLGPRFFDFFKVTRPLGCLTIIVIIFSFTTLSCALGVYFTIHKELGYSMGDSFTLASYVMGVGAVISGLIGAYHYPHCCCWRKDVRREAEIHGLDDVG